MESWLCSFRYIDTVLSEIGHVIWSIKLHVHRKRTTNTGTVHVHMLSDEIKCFSSKNLTYYTCTVYVTYMCNIHVHVLISLKIIMTLYFTFISMLHTIVCLACLLTSMTVLVEFTSSTRSGEDPMRCTGFSSRMDSLYTPGCTNIRPQVGVLAMASDIVE